MNWALACAAMVSLLACCYTHIFVKIDESNFLLLKPKYNSIFQLKVWKSHGLFRSQKGNKWIKLQIMSFCLSVLLSLCLSVFYFCLSVDLSVSYVFICVYLCFCLNLFMFLTVSTFISVCIYFYFCLHLLLFLFVSFYISVC